MILSPKSSVSHVFAGFINIHVLRLILHTVDNVWTKQEIRCMLNHLKEKGISFFCFVLCSKVYHSIAGMQSFITQYVLWREIPIPKLLTAFGVILVILLSIILLSLLIGFALVSRTQIQETEDSGVLS
jgi:hypothetical protein